MPCVLCASTLHHSCRAASVHQLMILVTLNVPATLLQHSKHGVLHAMQCIQPKPLSMRPSYIIASSSRRRCKKTRRDNSTSNKPQQRNHQQHMSANRPDVRSWLPAHTQKQRCACSCSSSQSVTHTNGIQLIAQQKQVRCSAVYNSQCT